MREKLKKNLCISIAVIICITFTMVLSIFISPMKDASYDLSLINQEAHFAEETETFDDKGWTVYTQEGDTVTLLTHAGGGSYSGIELGQTFYFSRVMDEDLDSPTLQIGTSERQFVVFLDNKVIYTDCPELDNRVGYLQLPMNDYVREDPIIITLPQNYQGKTLTIAQSTPPYSETSKVRAYPCSVRLYCGYSYESGLIAESFSTAIAAAVMFAVGVSLLVFFVRSGKMERLCMALAAFLWMTIQVIDTSFFNNYFGYFTPSGIKICRFLSVLALLVFLIQKSGNYGKKLWTLVGLYGASLAAYLVCVFLAPNSIGALHRLLGGQLTEWIIMVSFAVILVLGITVWKKESYFYRLFSPLSILGIAGYWVFMVLTKSQDVAIQFSVAVSDLMISYFCYPTIPIVMGSALVVALIEAAQHEWKQRTEKRLLEERREMTQVTYESMCSQHEEVMKLRHDMVGHLETLRGISDQAEITAYIDSLIGKNKRVRPIVHTGNEMLDIILGSKLSAAMDAGIKVEIPRSTAPGKLPIPDNDLSSIVINILNNAVTAACNSGAKEPFLKLDVHIKGSWLAIVCENSADIRQIEKKAKKETVPKHGLGLKIIEETAQQYGGLFDKEYGTDYFKISVILPIG